jgi:hypothetical protein
MFENTESRVTGRNGQGNYQEDMDKVVISFCTIVLSKDDYKIVLRFHSSPPKD